MTLTDERHPRLSVTRTRGKGLRQLGPFRSKRQADRIVRALWDATPIRRCSSGGRGCEFAQLGVAVCPCDGSVSDAEYRDVVQSVVDGIDHDPGAFTERIRTRLASLANHRRFEEAAELRDNWTALASALERHRATITLDRAGTIVAARDGALVSMTSGRFDAAWRVGSTPPLRTVPDERDFGIERVDEAMLLWRWLEHPSTELVDVSGTLASPSHGIPQLSALA